MKTFLKDLIVSVIADKRTQDAIENLLGAVITKNLLPMLPIAVSAATKAAVDQLVERVPQIEGVVDAVKVADDARVALNEIIPDIDFGIPALDAVLDMWRPKP